MTAPRFPLRANFYYIVLLHLGTNIRDECVLS